MGVELVRWRYSTTAGSAGNAQAQASPNASLGKFVSTTDWTGAVAGNLFDTQLTTDQLTGTPDHRCVFAVNLNGTIALREASVYLAGSLPTMSTIEIGLDPAATSAVGSASAQAAQIATETDAPVGVTFSQPVTAETAIPLGDLEVGTCRGVWVRRTPTGASAASDEAFTLRLSGTLTP